MNKRTYHGSPLPLFLCVLCGFLFGAASLQAGDLDSPAAPDNAGSAMYSITDIYNRLDSGTAGTLRGGAYTGPTTAPGSTTPTLNEVMEKAPALDNTNGATPAQVLKDKTYWGRRSGDEWGNQTGTMPIQSLSPTAVTVGAGYYEDTTLDTVDADLAAGNIKAGVNLFGITGTAEQASGNAADGDVLSGKSYSNTSGASTGTMADVGVQLIIPGTATQFINKGFHNGAGTVAGDTDLAAGNIRAGVNLFGVSGKPEVVDTSSGNAGAGEILNGFTAYVAGAEITGTMFNAGAQNITPGTTNQTITQGYHNGSGSVAGDAALVSGNIKHGIDLFGVSGALAGGTVVDPAAPTSPLGRWVSNGNGTITDTTTGLIWYHKGNNFWGAYQAVDLCPPAACIPPNPIADIAKMQQGVPADLTDGSSSFDWRPPTVNEMLHITSGTEAISPSTPYLFIGIQTGWYWTSSMDTNPTTMRFMRVQMPYTNPFGVAEDINALYWAMAVRNPL